MVLLGWEKLLCPDMSTMDKAAALVEAADAFPLDRNPYQVRPPRAQDPSAHRSRREEGPGSRPGPGPKELSGDSCSGECGVA